MCVFFFDTDDELLTECVAIAGDSSRAQHQRHGAQIADLKRQVPKQKRACIVFTIFTLYSSLAFFDVPFSIINATIISFLLSLPLPTQFLIFSFFLMHCN